MLYEKGTLDLCDNQQNTVMPVGVGQQEFERAVAVRGYVLSQ